MSLNAAQPSNDNLPLAPTNNLNAAELLMVCCVFIYQDLVFDFEFLQALMSAQQENGQLRAQIASLQQEVAELKLAAARPQRGPVTNDSATAASIKLSTAIARIAKFGQLFYSPCIPEEAFELARPDFAHDHPDRYLSENLSFSYTADLYHLFPPKYHDSIGKSDTVKSLVSTVSSSNILCTTSLTYYISFKFFTATSRGISSAIEQFRRQAGEIFGTAPEVFRKPHYPRASVARLRHLLGISKASDGRDVYAIFPPILFADGHESNMSYVFLNPVLFQVCDLCTVSQVVAGD